MPKLAIEPSDTALEIVEDLARHAAQNDHWMEPVFEKIRRYRHYEEFIQAHRDGWEETDHWSILYGQRIHLEALEEGLKHGIGRRLSEHGATFVGPFIDWETWFYDLYLPLEDAFWDEWEDAVNLYEGWDLAKNGLFAPVH